MKAFDEKNQYLNTLKNLRRLSEKVRIEHCEHFWIQQDLAFFNAAIRINGIYCFSSRFTKYQEAQHKKSFLGFSQHPCSQSQAYMSSATVSEIPARSPTRSSCSTNEKPFIDILYEMVGSNINRRGIGYSLDGNGLEVRDRDYLCASILPQYFKHSNFRSFVRQLNNYGFLSKCTFGILPEFATLTPSIIHSNAVRKTRFPWFCSSPFWGRKAY